MDKITLTLYKTANGFYVEHEADKVKNGYSVDCESGEWEALNPALAGTFETPFKAPEENESGTQKPKISELKAEIKMLKAAEKELHDLKEAAGGIDILQAIESAKKAQAQTNPQT
jgi:hypothetical protein